MTHKMLNINFISVIIISLITFLSLAAILFFPSPAMAYLADLTEDTSAGVSGLELILEFGAYFVDLFLLIIFLAIDFFCTLCFTILAFLNRFLFSHFEKGMQGYKIAKGFEIAFLTLTGFLGLFFMALMIQVSLYPYALSLAIYSCAVIFIIALNFRNTYLENMDILSA